MSVPEFLKGPSYPEKTDGETAEALQDRRLDWLRNKTNRLEFLAWAILLFHAALYGKMQGGLP